MLIPTGEYRYEIRRRGELVAIEEESFDGERIAGVRRAPDGSNPHEVEAEIAPDGTVRRVTVRYSRGPFARTAVYDAAEDFLRGMVSAVAGRNAITAKLGRYREIDADLVLFRALTIAHVRARGQTRWTGRVAAIDPATLVAASHKHTARAADSTGLKWIYEPRMGDSEEIELDALGRIVRRRDDRGIETVLLDR
jgi:hypothetical protein